ncbi:MAG: phenylalanine--tRNA ligase subunit alpha [Candidatus Theseobacter exili]|nr:phenylalanine--tRNA ligase subunit alpha [Candidatus Theseobacter exili]
MSGNAFSLKDIGDIQNDVLDEISQAGSLQVLEELRVRWLGRKGIVQDYLKNLGTLSKEERPVAGKVINELKDAVKTALEVSANGFQASETIRRLNDEKIDITLPGVRRNFGRIHPITKAMASILEIFIELGFSVKEGPEIETEYYNFEALNIPENHPARDMQDTFYVNGGWVLRTHTSPIQIRVMENNPPPLRFIAPGKAFRSDPPDASHTPMFHQVEGLFVDEGVHFGHLKYILDVFAKKMFGEKVRLRFRPSFFPFTEPSAEVDISCIICKGKGCRVCSRTGWLEILGAGMVDPEVFKAVDIDSERYTGFAFGMGIERIAMLKYGINDIRLFFENDKRFLDQF